ncbi:hypothetical protein [Jiangella endophytica]|uniref:hypothetical protein n=1 Tax=Jiangella endophytica TaxID=1623398 RepID=UPI000E3561D7|nr:hypothetical protein [Jiangella endophytica]
MAYEADVQRLSEHLAHLLTTPSSVDRQELEVVDAARIAVRQLCWRILRDVTFTPLGDTPTADLSSRTVATLQHVLRTEVHRLADTAGPGTGWIDYATTTDAGRSWREVHRHAVLTEHEWEMVYPQAHPHGTGAWPIITDVAAIAEAIAHLEQDAARDHPAAMDQAAALALAADQVRRLAPPGALDTDPAPLPSRSHQLLLRIRSAADLSGGTARLAYLLRTAHRLEPATVRAVARSQAQALLTIGRLIKTDTLYSPAQPQLRPLATSLARLSRLAERVRSSAPGDDRPRQQLQLLHDCWRFLDGPHEATQAERAAAYLAIHPALDIVHALHEVIHHHVSEGQWYQYLKGGRHPWRLTSDTTEPRIVEAAQRAVQQAEQLAHALPPTEQPAATVRAPRHVLAGPPATARPPADPRPAHLDATR